VCSGGTDDGSGATLYCCATYAPSADTCVQDTSIQSCGGSSIGFSCSGGNTPSQVDPSLTCGAGVASGDATLYCCAVQTAPPPTTTASCAADGNVQCTAPASGYSCTGGAAPTSLDATLNCGQPVTSGDTSAYCCAPQQQPPTAMCAADTTVTGCPGVATGYSCTGGANPETGNLLCGPVVTTRADGAQTYCCTP